MEENFHLTVCACCYKQSPTGKKFKYHCPACVEISYCSKECSNQIYIHIPNGLECRALKLLTIQRKSKLNNIEDLTNMRMMISVLSRAARESEADNPFVNAPSLEERNAELFSGACNPLFRHIYHLEGNESLQHTRPQIQQKIWEQSGIINEIITEAAKELSRKNFFPPKWWYEAVGEECIVQLLYKMMCNCFGLWNRKQRCIASIITSSNSYFNHSCLPNCCRFNANASGELLSSISIRTLRPIKKGEELTISYSGIKFPYPKRQEHLLYGYFFRCRCRRCTLEDSNNENSPSTIECELSEIVCTNTKCAGFMVVDDASVLKAVENSLECKKFVSRLCNICGRQEILISINK